MQRFLDKCKPLFIFSSPPKRQRNIQARSTLDSLTDPFQQFPIEITSLILQLLPVATLFESIQVSQQWCHLIIHQPKVLARLSHGVNAQLDKSLFESDHFMLGAILWQEFIFGYMDLIGRFEHLKSITLYWANFSRDKDGMHMGELLTNGRRGLLRELACIDCIFAPAHAGVLFDAIAYLDRLTIVNLSGLKEQTLARWRPRAPFMLTTLTFTCGNYSFTSRDWIMAVLSHCPYLEYLYLSDTLSVHGDWDFTVAIERASQTSPRLKVVIWTTGGKAVMPSDTLCKWPNRVEGDGMRYLVISGMSNSNRHNRLKTFIKKHHTSLELLYLHYDHNIVLPSALAALGKAGAPHLREIRLSTERGTGKGGPVNEIQSGLVNLFRGTPGLEAVQIVITTLPTPFRIGKDALRVLGTLEHLKVLHIIGQKDLSKEDFWPFCENGGGAALEVLRLSHFNSISTNEILEIKNSLPSLVEFDYA